MIFDKKEVTGYKCGMKLFASTFMIFLPHRQAIPLSLQSFERHVEQYS